MLLVACWFGLASLACHPSEPCAPLVPRCALGEPRRMTKRLAELWQRKNCRRHSWFYFIVICR